MHLPDITLGAYTAIILILGLGYIKQTVGGTWTGSPPQWFTTFDAFGGATILAVGALEMQNTFGKSRSGIMRSVI